MNVCAERTDGDVRRAPALPRRPRALVALFFAAIAAVAALPPPASGQPVLTVTPQSTVVGVGGTMHYQAVLRGSGPIPKYLDAAAVTWTSSDAAVLSIDPATGIATGHRAGGATIAAHYQGLSAQAPATVAGTVSAHSLVTPDGRTRTYALYTPATLAGGAAPLVLVYHGLGGTGRGMMHVTLMNAVAHRHGFLVAYPDGVVSAAAPAGWNSGADSTYPSHSEIDDVEFTRRLIDHVSSLRRVDPDRVYATGLSNGAKMAMRLGFELADRIAAVAPVAGTLVPGVGGFVPGPPTRPVSMIQFSGTTDLLQPYAVVPPRFDAWLERNRIPPASRLVSYRRGIVKCETYASAEAVATLCTAEPPAPIFADGTLYDGGGHAWPGGEKVDLPVGGDLPTRDIDASETMWAFFSAFGRLGAGGQRLAAAVLPSSRSASLGDAVTAFVTVVNPGPAPATGVTIAPAIPGPAAVSFRSTDPATNLPVGAPNAPVDIPPGESRTFAVLVEPTAPFGPAEMVLGYGGPATAPVAPLRGINTLLMSSEPGPVVDAVALAATPTADGILELPGPGQAAAFAVASVNVGEGGPVTARVDTGGIGVPVTMGICRTDPATSACITPVGSTVSVDMPAGARPTFGVFVVSDAVVGFDPAINRIFVRFVDADGITRGATSVAVRTRT
jgi:polyhydroxybutyrate depolymerase